MKEIREAYFMPPENDENIEETMEDVKPKG